MTSQDPEPPADVNPSREDSAPERIPAVNLYPSWMDRPLVTVLAGAVVAAFVGLTVPLSLFILQIGQDQEARAEAARADRAQQQRQFEEERAAELRSLRRETYLVYMRAANKWVNTQEARESCQPGTDTPVRPGASCSVGYLSELQSARYDLRLAQRGMSYVESYGAGAARRLMDSTMPSTEARDAGPVEGVIDDESFDHAYNLFQNQAVCDLNPDPEAAGGLIGVGTCDDILNQIVDELESPVVETPKPRRP